jgi:hypothetical protein
MFHRSSNAHLSDGLALVHRVEPHALNLEVRVYEERAVDLVEVMVVRVIPEYRHDPWSIRLTGDLTGESNGGRGLVHRVERATEQSRLLASNHDEDATTSDRTSVLEHGFGGSMARGICLQSVAELARIEDPARIDGRTPQQAGNITRTLAEKALEIGIVLEVVEVYLGSSEQAIREVAKARGHRCS